MFSEYPYVNKDDLNLDYILKKIKTINEKVSELEETGQSLSEEYETLKEELETLQSYYDALISGDYPPEFENVLNEYMTDWLYTEGIATLTGNNDISVVTPEIDMTQTVANSIVALIKEGHAFLLDFGYYPSYAYTKKMLDDYGVSIIDGVIITHYHGDHDGNPFSEAEDYSYFANDFDFSNCTFYLPITPDASVAGWDTSTEQKLRATFTTSTFLTAPYTDTIEFYGLTINCVNNTALDFAYYLTEDAGYNDYSQIIQVFGKGGSFIYFSDAGRRSQNRMYANGLLSPCDYFFAPHHGLNSEGSNDLALTLGAKHVHAIDRPLASSSWSDPILITSLANGAIFTRTSYSPKNSNIGGTAGTHFVFGGAGPKVSNYSVNATPTVYFNSDYTGQSDGSSARPFSNVQQLMTAIGYGFTKIVLQSNCPYLTMVGQGYIEIDGGGFSIAGASISRHTHLYVSNAVFTAEINCQAGAKVRLEGVTCNATLRVNSGAIVYAHNLTIGAAMAPYDGILIVDGLTQTQAGDYYISYGSRSIVLINFNISNIASTKTRGMIYNPLGYTSTSYDNDTTYFNRVYEQRTKFIGYNTSTNKAFINENGTIKTITTS